MHKLPLLLILTLILSLPLTVAQNTQSDLILLKISMEEKVKKIANSLSSQYLQNCTRDLAVCRDKSYNLCQGTGTRSCFENFPTSSQCLNQGIFLSKQSGVRFPNIFQSDLLNTQTRIFICNSAMIESTFHQIQSDNNIQYSYIYIGSESGSIRISPSFTQQLSSDGKTCMDYDPRVRPWYISSITAPKTIVILFDISKTMSSMHPGARFKSAEISLRVVFETLNHFDHVGVVTFSTGAQTLPGFSSIFAASEQNKTALLKQIPLITTAEGMTNYTAAFQLGVAMINNYSTNCSSTFFLLLTDGYTQNDDIESFQELIPTFISTNLNENRSLKLISFVYGSQENIQYQFVGILTNLFQGLLIRIVDGIDYSTMIDKLSPYYAFISEGLSTRTQPMWSQPYQDLFGFGTIMTVTIPVYAMNRIPKIIGVAAIDVRVSRFLQDSVTLSTIYSIFIKTPQCQQDLLDNVTLEYLRCMASIDKSCKNSTMAINYNNNCDDNITMDIFYPTVSDSTLDATRCCGPTITYFLSVLFESFGAGICVIISMTAYQKGLLRYLLSRGSKNRKQQRNILGSLSENSDEFIDSVNRQKYVTAEQAGIKIYHQPLFEI